MRLESQEMGRLIRWQGREVCWDTNEYHQLILIS